MKIRPALDYDAYVEVQRAHNSFHSDGNKEAYDEKAIAEATLLCKFIKKVGMRAESFLDAGCRLGYAMSGMASEFPSAHIVGIDIVPEFVEAATRHSDAVVGDLQSMPFYDREFDWVYCDSAIEHTPDPAKTARELQRVAAVGVYVITDLERDGTFNANKSHFVQCTDPLEWADLFRGEGWVAMGVTAMEPLRTKLLWVRREHYGAWVNGETGVA